MVPCNKNHENDNGWDFGETIFCPEFKPTDILRGDFYSKKYSWLRLVVYRCDTNDIIIKNGRKINKKCASRTEQDKFFSR